jgi:hypothetical protein
VAPCRGYVDEVWSTRSTGEPPPTDDVELLGVWLASGGYQPPPTSRLADQECIVVSANVIFGGRSLNSGRLRP